MNMTEKIELTAGGDASGMRLDKFLAEFGGISRNYASKARGIGVGICKRSAGGQESQA